MTCGHCGADNSAESRFCSACGQLLRTPDDERRVVTVLFADIAGFTALAEHRDPESVKRLIEEAFEGLVRHVNEYGGRVDKIVGDGILALFGAPVAHEDDPGRAVRAALRMHAEIAEFSGRSGAELGLRIGVNTGEVLVGALRSGGDYTAMGDVVNSASRLQAAAAPGEVLVGPDTYRATCDEIAYTPRGALVARGREQTIDAWVATEAVLPPGYRMRRIRSPLIGRDDELAVVRHAIALSLRQGRGLAVVISGEAGVGKSRLASEASAVFRELRPDGLVLNGRCVPYGEANPWWPVAEVLREGCGVERDDPLVRARAATLAAVGAVISDVDDAERVAEGILHLMGYEAVLYGRTGVEVRREARYALVSFLEAAVARTPILVRLADVHWADPVVVELIAELATTTLSRAPFVFIATARPVDSDGFAIPAGPHNMVAVHLDSLTSDDAARLVDELVPVSLPLSLRSALLDRAGGNPLYLEELVTLVLDDEIDEAGELPDTLRGLIAARVDALNPDEQRLLAYAAVWGSDGSLAVLERMVEATGAPFDARAVASSLVDHDVLSLDRHGVWQFRSDLVREVVYSRLTKRDRLKRHCGIAAYLDAAEGSRFADDRFVEVLARHYVEAHRLALEVGEPLEPEVVARARVWVVEAARRAERAASWARAATLFGVAVEMATEPPQLFVALLGSAHAHFELWDLDRARQLVEEAFGLAAGPEEQVRALTVQAEIATRARDWAIADASVDRAVGLAVELDDGALLGEALRTRGVSALIRNDLDAALPPLSQALELFRANDDARGVGWALQNLAWIAILSNELTHAESLVSEAIGEFAALSDAYGLAWSRGLLAFVRFTQGRNAEARELAVGVLAEAEQRGDRWGAGMMLVVLGAVSLWSGDAAQARSQARTAISEFRLLRDSTGLEQALSVAGRAEILSGNVAVGFDLIREAAVLNGEKLGVGVMALLGSSVAIGRPDRDVVSRLLALAEHGLALRSTELLVSLALAEAMDGNADEALALISQVVEPGIGGGEESSGRDSQTGYGVAALAVVGWLRRDHRAVETAQVVISGLDRATFVDRVFVGMMTALSAAVRGLPALVEETLAALRDGGPGHELMLIEGLVALTEAHAWRWLDDPRADAATARADGLWDHMGVHPDGWNSLMGREA